MAIDIRAEVSCSLGELISGSFADDYLQGSGLIKTRGEVVLSGTQTPAVGTLVTFSYDKGGITHQLPRVLRVMSSFADPFRRTTTVQLGCKLTYLENRKPPVKDPNSKEENSGVPCYVYEKATLPISAAYVLQECLTALGLTSAAIPLTNKFSVEEFPLDDGYINVISDLLQSEGYVGHLDTSEVLQFINLADESGSGPLVTKQDVIDLGPIGVGDLPGESVLVRYTSQRLLSPEELSESDYLKRTWEADESFGAPVSVTASYQDEQGNTVTALDTFYPYEFNAVRYDIWDRKIESVSYTVTSSASVNNRWASDALKRGVGWNRPTAKLTHEKLTYQIPAAAKNNVNLLEFQTSTSIGPSQIKALLYQAALADSGSVAECINDPPEGYDEVKSQSTTNYLSDLELAGGLNVDTFIDGDANTGTFLAFSTLASQTDSKVKLNYERDQASGYSKTLAEKYVARLQTAAGQQDLAKKAQEVDTGSFSGNIYSLLNDGKVLVYEGASTTLQNQKEFGLQRRPSQANRNNQGNSKPVITEQVAQIEWVVGSTTSTAVTEFSLPYAPDDEIAWSPATGYTSTPSDAPQKALRYGRIQNRLLLGNRNGVSLQLSPQLMPSQPFAPVYLEAEGVTGAYRVNGTSWAFDSNGIVASTDALLWGAVSADEDADLSATWLPLSPELSALPAPYEPVGGTIEPAYVLPPYAETVVVIGCVRSTAECGDYPYATDRGTEAVTLLTGTHVLTGAALSAEGADLEVTGETAGFALSRKIVASRGNFTASGAGAGNIRTYGIGTNAGVFAVSSKSAMLLYGRALSAAGASFTVLGKDAASLTGIRVALGAASYGLNGATASLKKDYALSALGQSLVVSGQEASLQVTDYFGSWGTQTYGEVLPRLPEWWAD